MGIVHKEAEPVFLLVLDDLGELALVAGHAEHAFGHDEDAATGLGGEGTGTVELLDEALHVVVVEDEALALVQADAVDRAGVALAVIHDDVVAADEGLDGALATLVAIVERKASSFCMNSASLFSSSSWNLVWPLMMRAPSGSPPHSFAASASTARTSGWLARPR